MLPRVVLERVLVRQAGVVTLAQALACGISADTVRRRVRAGAWRELHPCVYLPSTAAMVRLLGPFEVRCGKETLRLAARPSLLLATLACGLPRRCPTAGWPRCCGPAETSPRILGGRSRPMPLGCATYWAAVQSRPTVTGYGSSSTALALWRGEPLEGAALDLLKQAEGPALVEELLAATERAAQQRLELNQIDAVFLTTLNRLTCEHPWRERLWGQLMLGLHRSGRQREALTTYQRLVTTLREDLGVDPVPEIVRLHQHLLAGGPRVQPVRTKPPSSTATVPAPAQLPAVSPTFIGRRHTNSRRWEVCWAGKRARRGWRS
jgi:hypothetical protein